MKIRYRLLVCILKFNIDRGQIDCYVALALINKSLPYFFFTVIDNNKITIIDCSRVLS